MVKRLKIALIYSYSDGWIGGTYYILNIIRILNDLSFFKKPIIYLIIDNDKGLDLVKEINYPFIKLKSKSEDLYRLKGNEELNFIQKKINNFTRKFLKREILKQKKWINRIDILFPSDFDSVYESIKNKVYWIPDFQHKYLSYLFDEKELEDREDWYLKISNQNHLVLSSFNSLNDFNKFYPNSVINKYVYRFVSTHQVFEFSTIQQLNKKHDIGNSNYFFVANQFWQHKNHITVLKALQYLKQSTKLNFDVYFSGKQSDYRCTNYFNEILQTVNQFDLKSNVYFLGFIDRKDQLAFMKHSVAVIQPSLFEGWSTVVEDAKMLGKSVICSNIEVHKEQLNDKGFYFDCFDFISLSEHLCKLNALIPGDVNYNYHSEITKTSKFLYKTLKDISNSN
jgi:hypothetical protein